MRTLTLPPFICIFVAAVMAFAVTSTRACTFTPLTQAPPSPALDKTAPSSAAPDSQAARVTAYMLPPEEYAKARRLARIGYAAGILVPLYSLLVLYLFLRLGWSAQFRDWAEALAPREFPRVVIYCAAYFIAARLFLLPIRMWFHWLYRSYDLVVQGWGSWYGDQGKQLLITMVIGSFFVFALFLMIRRRPRRWWFYLWLCALPFFIFITFLWPLVIDPMFNKFEPLAGADPQLVNDLERVVNRAGLEIPPERMFLMKASEKVKFVNAYVTGIGASKRVVVWDTTIGKMTRPQILSVFGHEMGHYVLNHIYKGLILSAFGFLVGLFLADWISRGWLERYCTAWRIRGPADLAALPVYAIPILFLIFIATPVTNAFSRHFEHQADQYGLEVTHGLTPDSGQIAAQSFQILGEIDLEDPAPNRLEILWYWDHPWIGDRIQFALHYDPWSKGETGQFVK